MHGGERFREPVLIEPEVRAVSGELVEMAPLHQPKSLAALDAVSAVLPGVPAAACFDTAFQAILSAAAYPYALPARWRARWPVRLPRPVARLGGATRSAATRADPSALRIVSCHLGAGASLSAIAGGGSVDTTVGFTPLEDS